MENEYEYDNDDNQEELITPDLIINLYEKNKDDITHIKYTLRNYIEYYDIQYKIDEFKKIIYEMYIDIIEEFIEIDCPLEFFNKNDRLLHIKFIDWVYDNTDKGIELEYISNIYDMTFV